MEERKRSRAEESHARALPLRARVRTVANSATPSPPAVAAPRAPMCGGGAKERSRVISAGSSASSSTRSTASGVSSPPVSRARGEGGGGGGGTALSEANTLPPPTDAVWCTKRAELTEELALLAAAHRELGADRGSMQEAAEQMVVEHEEAVAALRAELSAAHASHREAMGAVQQREDACLAAKQRALMEIDQLRARATELHGSRERTCEAVVLAREHTEELRGAVASAQRTVAAEQQTLAGLQAEEERMKDSTYGLSGEAKDMVREMEQLRTARRHAEVSAMETEVARRELSSRCEELKGSIRVYCRVKGTRAECAEAAAARPTTADTTASRASCTTPASAGQRDDRDSATLFSPTAMADAHADEAGSCRSSTATIASAATSATVGRAAAVAATAATGSDVPLIYAFPDGAGRADAGEAADSADEFAVPRTLRVLQTRQNATSTGTHGTSETFSFDRVFDDAASQAAVYAEVEPLVHSAIDGYRVCVFAYGQTGSGKTYTMEGTLPRGKASSSSSSSSLSLSPAVGAGPGEGIIPRAMRTVFARQAELAGEGWSYTLSCSLVEIYNDVIYDLQQSPGASGTTPAAVTSGTAAPPHATKRSGDSASVSNVRLTALSSMEGFQAVYRRAIQARRTARTQLNVCSSRSHCLFTIYINGVNETIRQRSEGVLCLVDLAGSERVNESGVQGQQFKEAVNINKSLLDLGKCIHALRAGTVAPWRNCKLTHLLQSHLGAKGGKMLMLVSVSDRKEHLPESLNSLRFATRVSETVVGASVKRVTSF